MDDKTVQPTSGHPAGRPSPSADPVVRGRLLAWLDEALDRRLTLLVAGAGYGKTTLLRGWHPPAPVSWYTVGPRDRSLPVLLRGLADALAPHLVSLPADLVAAGLAQGPDTHEVDDRAEAAAGMLCDALAAQLDRDVVLVVDDTGELDNPASRFVEALCLHGPPRLHLVLASRTELPYRIHRLRAQGQVLELSGADLAFTPEESAAVVRGIVGDEDTALAEALHLATDGWPAALRLAVEAVRFKPPAARAATLAGLHRPGSTLFAYLAEEVLAQESPATQELLRCVGVLPRFTAELCEALGVAEAEATISSLSRRGMFVLPDVAHPGWMRLTGLVREFARQRLPLTPERRDEVLATVASWCEQAGHLGEALSARVAVGDAAQIAGLLRRHGAALLAGGLDDVVAAVATLPASLREPDIEQIAGEACRLRGDWDEALEHFRRAAGPATSLRPDLAWRMGLIRYLRGELGEALAVFSSADLTQGEPADRALVAAWAASAHWLRGAAEACAELAGQALASAREAHDPAALAAAHTVSGMLCALRSDRAGTTAHYARALSNAERADDVLQLIRIRSSRASRYLEEGEYEEALRDVDAALERADGAGYAVYRALALTNRGEAALRLGRLGDALVDLEAAQLAYQQLESRMVAYPLAQLGDVHWERGDTSLARAAYEEAIHHADAAGDAQSLVKALTGLAVTLAPTDTDQARRLADRAVAQGEQMGLVHALLASGAVAVAAADPAAAEQAGERAAAVARHRRNRGALAQALTLLGEVSLSPARARSQLDEAVAIWDALGSPLGKARAQLVLARRIAGVEEHIARALVEEVGATARAHGARVLASEAGVLEASLKRRARARVSIRVLGGFRVLVAGAPLGASRWPSHDTREFLKILVAHRGRPTFHATIAASLWPDDPARSRVPELIESLRTTLDPDGDVALDRYVGTDGDAVWLEVRALDIDVETFLRDASAGLDALPSEDALALLTRAEAAYTGDVLEENRTEEWAAGLREEARTVSIAVARALAAAAVAEEAHDRATHYLQRLLERDPYDEAAHLALVTCLSAAGRPREARRRYEIYQGRIEELGLEPAPFPEKPAADGPTSVEAERGLLRREGDVWVVAYRGHSARLRHSRGLEHLAVLLARPGQEVHAVELAGAQGGDAAGGAAAAAEGLHAGDAGLPVLDEQAKAAYRSRLQDLQDDLLEAERFADDERVAHARQEIDLLTAELAAAVGLGGRDRVVGSTAERARQATSKAVKVALARIAEQLPDLGEHLASTVHTGTYCSYTPDPRAPLRWEL